MTWRPIDEYLALPLGRRPRICMFRYEATKPNRPGGSALAVCYTDKYPFGLRVCTHFFHVGELKAEQGESK